MADAPIGIFDSGFGGLTVARAVLDQLPHEPVLYLGDTARQPYGPKPIGEVREYALECLDHLVDQGVKALVIACNSASAAVLRDARERYPVPVVEVIHPATRRAVAATRTGRIGVICTRATADSMAYDDAFTAAPHVTLHTQACPRFVEFVEAGVTSGPELMAVAHEYLDPLTSRRHRHPDPRLHALPAADRRRVLRDGRPGDAGVERRGDRQGRLPAARPARPRARPGAARARAPVPHHRPARRSSRAIGRRFLGPELESVHQLAQATTGRPYEGSPSSAARAPSPARTRPPPATSSRATQDGRTWRVLLDLGSGALGTLHRYVDPLTVDAVLFSHLHPDHYFDLSGLYVMWKYHPDGAAPRDPGLGPAAASAAQCARAYGLDPTTRHDAPSSTSTSTTTQPIRLGPFTITRDRVDHPVAAYGLRVEADGHGAGLLRRHRPLPGARRPRRRRRPAAVRGGVRRERRQPGRPAPDRQAGRRRRRPRPASVAGWC